MALSVIVSDMLLNLDILGSITNHQTLMVDGDRLRFDTRYAQWIRRSVTGDSRAQIQAAIDKTFSVCEELLHSYQCNIHIIQPDTAKMQHEQSMIVTNISDTLSSIISRKAKVIAGLEILSTFERYSADSEFKIQMTRFAERMQRITKWAETLLGIVQKHGLLPVVASAARPEPERPAAKSVPPKEKPGGLDKYGCSSPASAT